MKTINLGSGITMSVLPKPVADDGALVEVAVWKAGDIWVADTVDSLNAGNYAKHAKLRIPVAVLEGRAVPEPATAEPDWRGFVEIVGDGDIRRVYIRWHGVAYYLRKNSLWDRSGNGGSMFPTRAEAEAALAKAKHPGESA